MEAKEIISSLDFEVKGISCNSKEVSDGYIFAAIDGTRLDGRSFIDEAISRGAKAIVAQGPLRLHLSKKIKTIRVANVRRSLAELASEFYGDPSSKIKVLGVTGTNGKTTVTYLLEALLKGAGFRPAVIGTVNYRFKDKIIPSQNTTPGPVQLQALLSDIVKNNLTHAVMEVSSHALAQERTTGIDFHCAIFTNLTQDHLDYHGTLEGYFLAKSKLFTQAKRGSFSVINADDKFGIRLRRMLKGRRVVTYGINNTADISASNIKLGIARTEFDLKGLKEDARVKTKLIGRHNVYNILAACAWAGAEGLPVRSIRAALEGFDPVPGRLERVNNARGFSVYVDYAHTDDALFNVISSLRQIFKKKLIVVFGCGGERDRGKRPKMGRIVSEMADYAIITNDNPRSEDPGEIINGIVGGIRKKNYQAIPDRKKAIRKALLMAEKGDIVLIAGKGHENYQIRKNKTVHFDDREVARECLSLMK